MLETNSGADISKGAFEKLAQFAYAESGLILVPEKSVMIQSRLRPRLKSSGIGTFDDYVEFVCSEKGVSEHRFLISALTTNVSHFFREEHHFEIMIDKLKSVFEKAKVGKERLRIWSAGCSNGQEPYSIAMSVLEKIPLSSKIDFKILATDIDPKVVNFAKAGCYSTKMASNVPQELIEKYFENNGDEELSVKKELREKITFRELNLLREWPMKNTFDIIFCRNVVIYFDQETQQKLWPRFREKLTEQGNLFLGHSERMVSAEKFGFTSCGPTAYACEPTVNTITNNNNLEAHNGIA